MHYISFMLLHGSMVIFIQQVLEEYKDIMTKDYLCSTNHQNEQCLIQILYRNNIVSSI